MKHVREDYSRIQDPEGLIPEDEPVFLLRGQDELAPGTLQHWADELIARGGDVKLAQAAVAHAARMIQWQHAHGGKIPDAPRETIDQSNDQVREKLSCNAPTVVEIDIPQPGEIVHIFPGNGLPLPNGMKYAPAIVLQSWSEDLINCLMFTTDYVDRRVVGAHREVLWFIHFYGKKDNYPQDTWYWAWPKDPDPKKTFTIPRD